MEKKEEENHCLGIRGFAIIGLLQLVHPLIIDDKIIRFNCKEMCIIMVSSCLDFKKCMSRNFQISACAY